jgi:hypothetical protein
MNKQITSINKPMCFITIVSSYIILCNFNDNEKQTDERNVIAIAQMTFCFTWAKNLSELPTRLFKRQQFQIIK